MDIMVKFRCVTLVFSFHDDWVKYCFFCFGRSSLYNLRFTTTLWNPPLNSVSYNLYISNCFFFLNLQDPSIVHAGKSMSGSFQERRMYPAVEVPQSRPRAMTVEELEMEMRGEVPGSRAHKPPSPPREHGRIPGTQLPIGTPPTVHHIQQHIQVCVIL